MSKPSREKGRRRENQIVQRHLDLGIHAERVSGLYKPGEDVHVYPNGYEWTALEAEVKGRANGDGFRTLERWLGDLDVLFLYRDRAEPLVVLPWRVWAYALKRFDEAEPLMGAEGCGCCNGTGQRDGKQCGSCQ